MGGQVQEVLVEGGGQQGEVLHHIWKHLLKPEGQQKVKESPAFVQFVMKALLMFNANNI